MGPIGSGKAFPERASHGLTRDGNANEGVLDRSGRSWRLQAVRVWCYEVPRELANREEEKW